jgi:hypothetical protein
MSELHISYAENNEKEQVPFGIGWKNTFSFFFARLHPSDPIIKQKNMQVIKFKRFDGPEILLN